MKEKKRILLVTSVNSYNQVYGGPIAVIQRVANELRSKSDMYYWQPEVIFGSPQREERNLPLFLHVAKKLISRILDSNSLFRRVLAPIFAIRYLSKLSKHIAKCEQNLEENLEKICAANIIHCHDIYSMIALSNIIARAKLFRTTQTILLEIHSEGATSEEVFRSLPEQRSTLYGRYLRQYELYAINRAHYIILPSCGAKNQLIKHIPVLKSLNKRIHVIYNGIGEMNVIPKNEAKAMYGLYEENILILSVGRLVRDKGFDTLIKAIKVVIDSGFKNIHLLIAGEGPDRELLENLIKDLQLVSWVRLLGYIPHDKINVLYSAADVYVSSSRKAAFDLSLLEALSAGLPIIATNVGGNIEIIDNVGVLIEPEDPKTLASSLLRLVNDDSFRRKLADGAYRRFKENFSIEVAVNSYVKFLNTITT